MKALKILAGATGTIVLGIGVLLIAITVGMLSWIGRSDTVDLPQIQVETRETAVVVEDFELLGHRDGLALVDDLGNATITVQSRGGDDVFVGIADRRQIRAMFSDPSVDMVQDISWLAADRGKAPSLDFELRTGDWSLVMVGPGAESLDLTIDAEVTAAPFRAASAITGTIGAALTLLGGLLLWGALRRTPGGTPPPAAPPVPATA
jgi:hypothetical protein